MSGDGGPVRIELVDHDAVGNGRAIGFDRLDRLEPQAAGFLLKSLPGRLAVDSSGVSDFERIGQALFRVYDRMTNQPRS